jgi:hypothetical protein
MDIPTTTDPVSREEVLEAMAEVMERQARVTRAEAALASARRRLSESVTRLAGVHRGRGETLDLPPLAGLVLEEAAAGASQAGGEGDDERAGTLRQRIVRVMEASPDEVYTPARLAPEVGSQNRDSIRNTLLVLAAKAKIEKVGAGRYRARQGGG